MSPARCPVCRKDLPPRAGNPAHPFCSSRCQLTDLGRWLGEGYRVPGGPAGDGSPGAPEGEDA